MEQIKKELLEVVKKEQVRCKRVLADAKALIASGIKVNGKTDIDFINIDIEYTNKLAYLQILEENIKILCESFNIKSR